VAELQAELHRVSPALDKALEDLRLMEDSVLAHAVGGRALEERVRDTEQMCWDLSNELEAEERKLGAAEDRAKRAEQGMVELRCKLVSLEQSHRSHH